MGVVILRYALLAHVAQMEEYTIFNREVTSSNLAVGNNVLGATCAPSTPNVKVTYPSKRSCSEGGRKLKHSTLAVVG